MINSTITTPPPQHQEHQPGKENEMKPQPQADNPEYKGSNKLKDRIALITGGDSGIGRAVAIAFAKEGANIIISYLDEHDDARETERQINELGAECAIFAGDIGDHQFCQELLKNSIARFGKLDILVNNAGEQHPQEKFEAITPEQLERTFRTNIFSFFYLTQVALPHLQQEVLLLIRLQ